MRNLLGYRAGIALVVALVTTFTRPDNATLGLALFGAYAMVLAMGTSVLGALRTKPRLAMNFVPQAILAFVGGVAALISLGSAPSFQLAALQLLLLLHLTLTGAIEAYLAYRVRANRLEAREHFIAAGLSVAIGLILAFIEPQPVNILGFFGAYLSITAVHLGIWAASPKKAD